MFNLTVAEVPEFFANGILVHNCAAVGMGLTACVPEIRPGGKIGPTAVPKTDAIDERQDQTRPPMPGPGIHRDWASAFGMYGMGRR